MAWSRWFDLTAIAVANEVPTTCGVFCIARKASVVAYPNATSATVYLGAAADRQRGLRAVLAELAAGRRGDLEAERRQHGGLRFCFQANLGDRAGVLLTEILADFIARHGVAPTCNKGRL